jgi:hypothetical protein
VAGHLGWAGTAQPSVSREPSGPAAHPPAPRTERSYAWATRPHQRGRCRPASQASDGVEWPSVSRLELFATRTHAWLMVRPRARNARDGMRPCYASDVDEYATRAPHGFEVAPGAARGATVAYGRRPDPQEVCGARLLLLPKPGGRTHAAAVNRPEVRAGSGEKMPPVFAQGVVHLLPAGGLIRVRGWSMEPRSRRGHPP